MPMVTKYQVTAVYNSNNPDKTKHGYNGSTHDTEAEAKAHAKLLKDTEPTVKTSIEPIQVEENV